MSGYINKLELIKKAVASEASDDVDWETYAEGASRLFDKLCEVEDGFFAKAASNPSERSFYGNGVDMMRLPPFVGTITTVSIDGEEMDADDWRITNGYLYHLGDGEFDTDEEITISARWGFADVPKDVEIIVAELAIYLWRARDPMFNQMSETELQENLSPTINAAIKKYRDLYSRSAY